MCESIRRSCNSMVVFLNSYFKSGITLRNYLKSSYFIENLHKGIEKFSISTILCPENKMIG